MKIKGIVCAAILAAALVPAAAMAYDYDGWQADFDSWEYYYDGEEADSDYDPDYDADSDYDAEEDATWEDDGDAYESDDAWEEDGEEYDEGDWEADEDDLEADDEWESDSLNEFDGTYWYDDRLETWYSSEDSYHYLTDEWWVDDEGFYRTDEGYYVVAASDYEYGSVIDGSKGACIVLDDGCDSGVTDYYVAW